ncbi:glycosyltransferase family 2 protein [uncultured Psychroserpens sp.]|uniref:glycosyltransferase family 2 protein n=1 Tax=uncultured Psychroserpens sp. TaxID=255436 RepID=UPI002633CB0A|nr:glycosyltransferase family 2 protein [uncultured Psychroserpens sp.]
MKVSVILPNYNHADYLEERLDSIVNQTYQNFELIILDDASTDNSLEVLNRYASHEKVSHFIINENNSGSPFLQWKKGLNLATGDYIWIAESDDSCELDFIETHVKHLQKFDVSVAKTLIISEEGKTNKALEHPIVVNESQLTITAKHFVNCPISNVSTAMFKTIDKAKLEASTFSEYNLIGDLVFYFEFFNTLNITENIDTTSYFRQFGLSNLTTKSMRYFHKYLVEHIRFIKYVNTIEKGTIKHLVKPYIKRRFYKIMHRKTFNEKLSPRFFIIFLKYKYEMLIN